MMSGVAERSSYQQKSILGNMDSLWFHKAVIFSQPIRVPSKVIARTDRTLMSPNTFSMVSSSPWDDDDQEEMVVLDVEDEGLTSGGASVISSSQDGDFDVVTEEDGEVRVGETLAKISTWPQLPTESNLSKSTPTHRRHRGRRLRVAAASRVLDRTLSCKTLAELEEEEVKGFMDLGFNFEKDRLTPRMMSILPGLQRLQQGEENGGDDVEEEHKDGEEEHKDGMSSTSETTTMEDVESSGGQVKSRRPPYLSESWSIERPDSPLLRMRMPSAFSAPDDMKRLLKVWVKTVAVAVRD